MNVRLMGMSVMLACTLSGCFLFKIFDHKKLSNSNWRIQKVEMDHKTYNIDTMLADSAFRENQEDEGLSTDNTALPKEKAKTIEMEQKEKKKHWYERWYALLRKKPRPKNSMGEFVFDQNEERIYGRGYCNRYFASYMWWDNNHIKVEDSGISRKVCRDEHLMAFELDFMENFKGMFVLTRGKNTLILDNQKMKIYLVTP
ncbi:META domain-containing protein [Helicobacter cetorum]|uniref:META domain-containing protein n=1 Tax=Helicobacter cetorum TaxID=138563 RepID=UPI000CF046BE|nr:META domain-containing protein [Helicobacter cetorum]